MENSNNYENEIIKHVKTSNGMEYIQFKELLKIAPDLCHAFFLRHGGVSTAEFKSLNVRIPASVCLNYEQENVTNNVKLICDSLNIDIDNIYKGRQAHTNNILNLDNASNNRQLRYLDHAYDAYDGYVFSKPNVFSLLGTADCMPVILYDKENKVAGSVHCGWKGILNGVIISAINKMVKEYGTSAKDLSVFIGPCISSCCFTTKDKSFTDEFCKVCDDMSWVDFREERYHIDLKKIVSSILKKNMVDEKNIHCCDICTKCNVKDFYSYRYCTENDIKEYGCFATIVGFRSSSNI